MRLPRWFAFLVAKLGGYFWLPCPVCGEGFAGFEGTFGVGVNHRVIGDATHAAECVCNKPGCVAEGRRQTNEFFNSARRWVL